MQALPLIERSSQTALRLEPGVIQVTSDGTTSKGARSPAAPSRARPGTDMQGSRPSARLEAASAQDRRSDQERDDARPDAIVGRRTPCAVSVITTTGGPSAPVSPPPRARLRQDGGIGPIAATASGHRRNSRHVHADQLSGPPPRRSCDTSWTWPVLRPSWATRRLESATTASAPTPAPCALATARAKRSELAWERSGPAQFYVRHSACVSLTGAARSDINASHRQSCGSAGGLV